MGQVYLFAAQLAQEFHIVIAGHAQGVSRCNHLHHETQYGANMRTAIDEVAEENRFPARRWSESNVSPGNGCFIAESLQQRNQFLETAVYITDDVERTVLVLEIVV